jgi:hypothetical protein
MAPNKRGGALTQDPAGGSVLSQQEIADRGTGTQARFSRPVSYLLLLATTQLMAKSRLYPLCLTQLSAYCTSPQLLLLSASCPWQQPNDCPHQLQRAPTPAMRATAAATPQEDRDTYDGSRLAASETRTFFTAVMFLTRLPCPSWTDHHPAFLMRSMAYFPFTGAPPLATRDDERCGCAQCPWRTSRSRVRCCGSRA